MTGGDGPAARARSIGIPGAEVDGNDVLAVEGAVAELLGAVRAGNGPRFLHARTYRLTGHTGADPAAYRPKSEVEARWKDDPIARLAGHLRLAGVPEADIAADAEAARGEMRNAFADVQDVGDPRAEAY
jgi:acetoin:2,6-dichlorophenolindophenol oxidoreductase subunit alpha